MPGRSPRHTHRQFARLRLLALTPLLALPSCFTLMVWGDSGRDESSSWTQKPPELRAFRSPTAASDLLIEASPALREELRASLPGLPADARWFHVALAPHSIAARLAALDEPDAAFVARLELRSRAGERPRLMLWLEPRQGSERPGTTVPSFALATMTPIDEPTDPGALQRSIVFEHRRIVHHDPNVVGQVALTPFVVALDVVLSPIELLGYLVLVGSGYHG